MEGASFGQPQTLIRVTTWVRRTAAEAGWGRRRCGDSARRSGQCGAMGNVGRWQCRGDGQRGCIVPAACAWCRCSVRCGPGAGAGPVPVPVRSGAGPGPGVLGSSLAMTSCRLWCWLWVELIKPDPLGVS
uniref:Uncharacterized protein n=1 Tax=Malurus cyaneus samueli TaxID=2593467 RepID=A0A8C5TVC2_9PASS